MSRAPFLPPGAASGFLASLPVPIRIRPVFGATALALVLAQPARAADEREASVGMNARIDQLLLSGSELEARPLDDSSPIVLRIAGAYVHGTAGYRYDLVYAGLEPGEFDLRDFLQRKDSSSTADLPPIRVKISAVLEPGQVEPHAVETSGPPRLGGYWNRISVAAVVWVLGLVAILAWMLVGKLRRRTAADRARRSLSLADRLRPIVEDAIAGTAGQERLAELERLLLTFWRRRLKLQDVNASRAMAVLREHEEAGELLRQLEIWLHRPGSPRDLDVATLLKPYRDLAADSLE